ncbi:MAG: porin [Alphaproteobacteria bacterium]|nr:porin [Alphaproteobacteria bacterium]
MLSSKNKVMSLVAGSLLLATAASAEVSFSGGAELDLMYKTNQTQSSNPDKARGGFGQEASVVLNVDGTHEGNAVFKTLKWRLAQKAATDYRYDPLGIREAWVGTETDVGEFRGGNQFSNLYLALDGFYSAHGTGNLMGDFGAHEVQYTRGLTYISPVFEGFQFSTQYDMGGKHNYQTWTKGTDVYGTTYQKENTGTILTSYANEFLLTYDSTYVHLDAGYFRGVNSGTADNFVSDAFGGTRVDQGSAYGTNRNLAEEFVGGAMFKIADFNIYAAYSHSHKQFRDRLNPAEDETFSAQGNDGMDYVVNESLDKTGAPSINRRIHKIGVGASYKFLEKNSVGLGYVNVFNSYGTGGEVKDGLSSYYAQYNYAINDNVSTFVQARHATFNTKGNSSWVTDGGATNAKDVTRILVGTYISF